MAPLDRLKDAINMLKKSKENFTNEMISNELMYSPTYLSDILGASKPINNLFLRRLEAEYSINREWIMKGEGDMFVNETGGMVTEPAAPYVHGQKAGKKRAGKIGWAGVPVFDVPIASGVINHQSMPVGYMSIPRFKDCVFGIQVSGEDMAPKICSGDYIFCKEVDINEIIVGEAYLILTRKGNEVVGYVQPHKTRSGYLSLTSEKQPKSSTALAITAIRKIYKVKGVVRSY